MIEFKGKFTIPHFLLTLSEDGVCEFRKSGESETSKKLEFRSSSKTLRIEFSNFHPRPCFVEDEKAVVIVLGSPIYDDIKVDPEKTAKAFLNDFSTKIAFELINGEFLAIYFSKRDGALKFINDRWCSIPLHYHLCEEKKIFCASPCFTSLWNFLKSNNLLELNQEAFFEFLWFQRLFGTKTLAQRTDFMPDAHIISLNAWKLVLERYWQRNYQKNKNPLDANAYALAEFIRQSITMKTADGKKYGHFLSGGMDSRSVLAGFKEVLPTCFTVGASDNREVRTAKMLAKAKGAEHYFLKLHPEHYGMIRKVAVDICGGMFNYDHALFLGYEDVIAKQANVCFNGYGLDFMFQGMYIPVTHLKLAGRNLYFSRKVEPPENIAEYFINNASYRIKNADIWAFVSEKRKNELKDFQRNSIENILKNGKDLTEDKFDLWEYLTFHHLSRHYSYPNVLSIKSFADARVLSFTNEIFDFYLSLPVEHRFDGKIEKRMLQILDPALAKIPSANTGMPITALGFERTVYQIFNAIKRRYLAEKDFESWTERTWPSREYAIRKQNSLKKSVNEIIKSNILEKLDFLDFSKIADSVPRWLEGEEVAGLSGDFIQTIITMGTFLKQS